MVYKLFSLILSGFWENCKKMSKIDSKKRDRADIKLLHCTNGTLRTKFLGPCVLTSHPVAEICVLWNQIFKFVETSLGRCSSDIKASIITNKWKTWKYKIRISPWTQHINPFLFKKNAHLFLLRFLIRN